METITISRGEYEALKSENAELNQKVEWLMEQLRLARKKQFGASSEKTECDAGEQLRLLFNEAEAYAAPPGPKKVTQVAAHVRKQSGSVKDVVPENIPVEVVEHRLSEEERQCPRCGETMSEIGKEVRETLVLVPAKAVLRREVYYTDSKTRKYRHYFPAKNSDIWVLAGNSVPDIFEDCYMPAKTARRTRKPTGKKRMFQRRF